MKRNFRRARTAGLLLTFGAGLASLGMGVLPAAARATPRYQVLHTIPLPGNEGWDALTCDSQAHRLYISHGTQVLVVRTDNNQLIGQIPNTPGVHGIAIAPRYGRGYTSNGRDNTVTVFSLKTLREVGRVKVGARPDAIIYDAPSDRVFTFNGGDDSATAIDAATGKVAGTIALGGKPEFAVSDGKGRVYLNLEDKSELLQLDPRRLAVLQRWPLAPGEEPSGIALDTQHHLLFSACGNHKLIVLNERTGRRVATVPIGNGVDGCDFDPAYRIAFSPNGRDGTLSIIHVATDGKCTVIDTVPTQRSARTIALDPATHRVYLVAAKMKTPPAAAGTPPTGTPAVGGRRRRPQYIPGSFNLLVVARR